MFKKIYNSFKRIVLEEWKMIILLLLIYIICMFPINYYIVIGGGISDIASRVSVEDEYKSKGSFNISYVTEIEGRFGPYLLSYIMPDWKRVSANDYKYDDSESFEDIQFRSDLDLISANSNAIMWAYKLADKKIEVLDVKIYVTTVSDGASNKLKVKDQILSINGVSFDNALDYQKYLQDFKVNDYVDVKVLRNKKEKIIKVRLSSYQNRIIMGVGLGVIKDYKTDPKVDINFLKDESGPSGGLITTLSIYDKLVEKDMTKSLKIAGTGTIEEDGTIGEIGEVKYKLLGASKEKADVFLVPKGDNYDTCMQVVKEKKLNIKVIGVSDIYEAICELEKL